MYFCNLRNVCYCHYRFNALICYCNNVKAFSDHFEKVEKMKKRFVKKLLISAAAACALFAAMTISAFACTTIYVGGDLTEEGAPIVARSEDYVNSQNKLFYISEAGEYKAGTVYHGCDYYGGFEWKMNHDSYRFTAFTADILHDGKCPECGKPLA